MSKRWDGLFRKKLVATIIELLFDMSALPLPPLHLKGGRIIDPANRRDEVGDLYLYEGKIADPKKLPLEAQWTAIDCQDLIITPGLIDLHVHLREPGQTHKETIATGSKSAAAGGFTTLLAMPNTTPVADTAETIEWMRDRAIETAEVNVYFTGCITEKMAGEKLTDLESLKEAGAIAITDDGKCVQNNALMREALEQTARLNLPMLDHCQDSALTVGSVMHEGEWSRKLGVTGWPSVAEEIIVSRNALLSEITNGVISCQHLSSAGSVRILREAKKRGVRIYGEAMPHHLAFTDASLANRDTDFKMNPPLRTQKDIEALLEGLADDTIELLASDHAPHSIEEKKAGLEKAPLGVIGLETELAVFIKTLIDSKVLSWSRMIHKMTVDPAKLLNLDRGTLSIGKVADVTVIDPNLEWKVDKNQLVSKSRNCPFHGMELRGRAVRTIVGGKLIWSLKG